MSSNRIVYLSILLPVYNETGNAINAVKTNAAAGRELAVPFEIIAINDGSIDDTGKLLTELKTDYPELRVVTHKVNQGFGAAIQTGLKAAQGEFCIASPADSPHNVEALRPFLAVADEADVVLGYRTERIGYSRLMRFNSWLYLKLLRMFCGLLYRDVNWIHLYRRHIFEHIDLEFTGIAMEAEVVLKAHALGMRIREVPCPMQERMYGRASAGQLKVMIRTGRDLLRLLWRWRSGSLQAKLGKGILTNETREVTI